MKRSFAFASLLLFLAASAAVLVGAQDWETRGKLITDVSRQESILWLDDASAIQVDQPVLIEARDRSYTDTSEVLHVHEDRVLLKTPLNREFMRGSTVFQ